MRSHPFRHLVLSLALAKSSVNICYQHHNCFSQRLCRILCCLDPEGLTTGTFFRGTRMIWTPWLLGVEMLAYCVLRKEPNPAGIKG